MIEYKNGRVSILIPCYNGAQYIEQCFESVLNQTYADIDILFVDDGSSDDSYNIALAYEPLFAEKGMKLTCYRKENGGAASAIQVALHNLTSEFFQLLDIDDSIYPRNIEHMVAYLKEHPEFNFVRCDGDIFNIEQGRIVSAFTVRPDECCSYNIFEDLLFGKTYNWAGTYLIRSQAFFEVNRGKQIYLSRYGQNMQILLPLASNGECGFVPEKLARYNEYPFSVSHEVAYDKNVKLLKGYQDIRIQVLRQMGRTDKDLLNRINQFYALELMKLASRYSKKKDVVKNFRYVVKTPKNILLFLCGISNIFSKIYLKIAKKMKRVGQDAVSDSTLKG